MSKLFKKPTGWQPVCTCVALLNCVFITDSQSLRLDDDVEYPEEDPFMAKLSFEVRERFID